MSEWAIFREINSVFEGPMDDNVDFPLKILQMCGDGSKTLSSTVLSVLWLAETIKFLFTFWLKMT